MVSLQTPICDFGWKAPDFALIGTDGKTYTLSDVRGPKGTLVMFICNHCPYVKAIRPRLVRDLKELKAMGVNAIAIMSNDPTDYPEDGFEHMQVVAQEFDFPFPYVIDPTQEIAKTYGVHPGFLRFQCRSGAAISRPFRRVAQGNRAGGCASRPF